ncbi:MAG: HIT family protein [Candidatus Woesearchaeota archaeon]
MTDQFEEQKKNCPFCKIIKGEIPSKKLYENDNHDKDLKISAILDINPLTEGHTLVLPKEHYPILPLVPNKTIDEIFRIVVDISDTLKSVLLKQCSTIFVANGAAAGQQSSHFMVHIIPRDETEAKNFNLEEKEVPQENLEKIRNKFAQVISVMFKNDYMKYPLKDNEGKVINLGYGNSLEMAINVLEQNPQIKELLLNNKEEFIKAVNNDERAKAIFESVDLDELIVKLGGKPPEKKETNEKKTLKPIDVALAVMNESPKLCELLINNKEEFIKVINADRKAKLIFEPVDLDELTNILKNQIKKENNVEESENKEKKIDNQETNTKEVIIDENNSDNVDKKSLDKISELFK